nr:ABC transporter ATP-binding protein [Jongsikchunia kroppenstedtii]
MLSPVRDRIRVAQLVQLLASAATVVPFIGVVELGRTLLKSGPLDTGRVWAIVLFVLAGLFVRAVGSAAALSITHFADIELQAVLRRRIVDKLGRLPLGWFTRTSSGQVRKATQNDVATLHYLVAHANVETTAAATTPVFALIYCFTLDWRLGLLAIATLPLYVLAYAWMIRDMTDQMAKMNAGIERISSTIVEFVAGISVVKTFGQTGKAHRRFADAADSFNDDFAGYVGPLLRLEAVAAMVLSAPLILLVNLAGGYWFIDSGWVEPIEVLGSALIAMTLPTAIITVSMSMHSRQDAGAAAGRLLQLLAQEELAEPVKAAVPQNNSVEFDDVEFSYRSETGDAVTAVDGVTLTLPPGSLTALVGPSGSGKSTLATLVMRFNDVDSGAVRIGGVDVRNIDPAALYQRVGFVLQDVSLLGISIRDNIALARPDAGERDIRAAAAAANIDGRIMALPRGYDSVVGEHAQLSGGEAQRVSIARALLADAPILVLDEATAFADPESEAQIQEAIGRLVAGRTVLVIAHRLGTIVHADNIAVLVDGRIAEQGKHDDLVAADSVYASMWRSYLAGSAHLDAELAHRTSIDGESPE